jgi:hypothetical protein
LNIRFSVYFLLFLPKSLVVFASKEISKITAIITRTKAIIVENRRNIPIKINGVRIEIQSLFDREMRTFRLRNIKTAIASPI